MQQKQVVFRQAGWLFALVILALLVAACQPAATQQAPAAPTEAVPVTGETVSPTATVEAMPTEAAPTEAAPTEAAPTEAAATQSEPTATEAAGAAPVASAPDTVKLTIREDPTLGKFLADERGMSLYLYTKDPLGMSVCEGGCLANWPALLVAEGGTIEIDGVENDARLGTVTRSDGTTQVAYNGYPLYYWVKDTKPGDVTGQGVGNVWFIVPPQENVEANTGAAPASGGSTANAPDEVRLTVREDEKLGKFFADEKGMSLYLYTKDVPGVSVCEDACLANWPPLLVADGGKIEIDGMDEDANLGTITRSDGSQQVAYKGMALYYWVKDTQPGDVTGHGVGNVWYVVPPDTTNSTGGNNSSAGSSSNSNSASGSSSASDEVKLTIRETAELGKFLADERGMTLYLFTKDTAGKSVCEGDCLAKWPPLLVAQGGEVEVDGMDEEGKVGTITRSDGTTQVTYNGMPLYYWVNDKQPGDTTGQGVGSVWFVVAP